MKRGGQVKIKTNIKHDFCGEVAEKAESAGHDFEVIEF